MRQSLGSDGAMSKQSCAISRHHPALRIVYMLALNNTIHAVVAHVQDDLGLHSMNGAAAQVTNLWPTCKQEQL